MSNIYNIENYRAKKKKDRKRMYIVIGSIISFFLFIFSPIFSINEFEITGNKIYTKEEIIESIDLKGQNFFVLLTQNVKNKIIKNGKASDVDVFFHFPNKLSLDLVENPPLGYIEKGSTRIYLDKKGYVIEISDKESRKIPKLVGLDVLEFKYGQQININDKDLLDKVGNLISVLNKYNLNNSTIDFKNKLEIHITIGSIDAIFGELKEIDEKVRKLSEVINRLSQKDKGTLDLSTYKDKIIFSPKE